MNKSIVPNYIKVALENRLSAEFDKIKDRMVKELEDKKREFFTDFVIEMAEIMNVETMGNDITFKIRDADIKPKD